MKYIKYVVVGITLIAACYAAFAYRQNALEVARSGPANALQQLADEFWVWYDPEMLSALALNKATPPAVRAKIAMSRFVPTDILDKLMADNLFEVRVAAASNLRTTAEGLRQILKIHDGSSKVKYKVVEHPNTPCEVLRELATSHYDRIQFEAEKRLTGCPAAASSVAAIPVEDSGADEAQAAIAKEDQSSTPECAKPDDIIQYAYANCVQRMREQLSAKKTASESSPPPDLNTHRSIALTSATDKNHVEIVKLLLAAGVKPTENDMSVAISRNNIDIVKLFLAEGFIPNERVVVWAVRGNRGEIVKLFLAYGFKPNEHGEVLIEAIESQNVEIVKLLLVEGANLNERSRDGRTPLIFATICGNTEIIAALLDHGADINQRGDKNWDQGRTALIRAVESDSVDRVELLLARGADPLLVDMHGWTAIHYAAKDGYRPTLATLVAHGIDVNLRISTGNHTGQTPLIAAAYDGHARTISWLLEQGADPALQDRYGYTALRLAQERGNTDAVAVLVRGRLVPFRDSAHERWGYKRSDESFAITPRFKGAGKFSGGRAPVEDEKGFALIDEQGNVVDRIEIDSVAGGKTPIPAPDKSCAWTGETGYPQGPPSNGLECYEKQLRGSGLVVGGKFSRNPTDGEGHSSGAFFRLPGGVIVIDHFGYEGSSKRVLLPGVSTELALKWRRMLLPDRPPQDGCDEGMNSGEVKGGAFIEYSAGC